jgi:allantoinase
MFDDEVILDRHRLRSRHVVTPEGVRDAVVEFGDGRILSITDADSVAPDAVGIDDLGDHWLLPGLVDTHVHVNDPGRAEWEGFPTATRAAAAGGITTLVDMPLNSSPATCTAAALAEKLRAAAGRTSVDVAFWGGVVPGNTGELEALARDGVRGFKCFLSPSGVEDFPNVSEADLREAMPVIAKLGLPLLVHAELPAALDAAAKDRAVRNGDPQRYATWLASRPPAAEVEAIALMIRLAQETGCRVHVVHLAAADALPLLRDARRAGVPITVETCPHYLIIDAEAIRTGATQFKCAPPIRERANRERLWEAVHAGEIDLVATDHSPCPPEMKLPQDGDFLRAWGGIASLEVSLAAMWTEGNMRGLTLPDLARLMSAAPARLAGLAGRKGAIAPGHDADLVAFDPDAMWVVEPRALRQRHKVTPYAGRTLQGRVAATWLRGRLIYHEGKFADPPLGQPLCDPTTRASVRGS